MKENMLKQLEALHEEMIDLRRDFHMYPELSFQEERTRKVIAEYQRNLGLEVRENVGGNGVVATLSGGKAGKTIAIRADFDALPITEENDVPYKSKHDGVMHACGHDAHTAIALGMAKALSTMKEELPGNVVFIHQHAEEVDPGGAKSMIEDGALDGVDVIFATHMENYIPVDHIWHNDHYILGAADDFTITIKGNGGHAAFPQDTTDVISIGSQLVNNFQHMMTRKVDPLKPAVLTIGSFQAGTVANVISEEAILTGTIRMFDEEVREELRKMIKDIVAHTCHMFGSNFDIHFDYGYPATKNDATVNQLLVNAAKDIIPEQNIQVVEPNMGTEDFSYFTQEVPGTYFFTGSANEEKGFIHPYHHPKFDIDEKALLNGAQIMMAAMFDYWHTYNK